MVRCCVMSSVRIVAMAIRFNENLSENANKIALPMATF